MIARAGRPTRTGRRFAIAILAAVSGCASTGAAASRANGGPVRGLGPALVGTWELVSTRVTRGDRTLLDEGAGRTYTFHIRVDGDRWTTDGATGGDHLHEVWRRVP